MTFHEIVMLALISLPFALIGWVGGMMFMRWQYLERLRRQDRLIMKLTRMIKAPQAGQNL